MDEELAELYEVVRKEAPRLLKNNNVLGVGVGSKYRGGKNTRKLAVIVFVKNKLPLESLKPDDVISISGYMTDVEEYNEEEYCQTIKNRADWRKISISSDKYPTKDSDVKSYRVTDFTTSFRFPDDTEKFDLTPFVIREGKNKITYCGQNIKCEFMNNERLKGESSGTLGCVLYYPAKVAGKNISIPYGLSNNHVVLKHGRGLVDSDETIAEAGDKTTEIKINSIVQFRADTDRGIPSLLSKLTRQKLPGIPQIVSNTFQDFALFKLHNLFIEFEPECFSDEQSTSTKEFIKELYAHTEPDMTESRANELFDTYRKRESVAENSYFNLNRRGETPVHYNAENAPIPFDIERGKISQVSSIDLGKVHEEFEVIKAGERTGITRGRATVANCFVRKAYYDDKKMKAQKKDAKLAIKDIQKKYIAKVLYRIVNIESVRNVDIYDMESKFESELFNQAKIQAHNEKKVEISEKLKEGESLEGEMEKEYISGEILPLRREAKAIMKVKRTRFGDHGDSGSIIQSKGKNGFAAQAILIAGDTLQKYNNIYKVNASYTFEETEQEVIIATPIFDILKQSGMRIEKDFLTVHKWSYPVAASEEEIEVFTKEPWGKDFHLKKDYSYRGPDFISFPETETGSVGLHRYLIDKETNDYCYILSNLSTKEINESYVLEGKIGKIIPWSRAKEREYEENSEIKSLFGSKLAGQEGIYSKIYSGKGKKSRSDVPIGFVKKLPDEE